jgi:hypothetical protein
MPRRVLERRAGPGRNDGSSLRSPSPARGTPADDIFAYSCRPEPVPPRSPGQVPDPRKRRGRRHPLTGLLAVGIAAVIAGSRSFAPIGQWAADSWVMRPRRAGFLGRASARARLAWCLSSSLRAPDRLRFEGCGAGIAWRRTRRSHAVRPPAEQLRGARRVRSELGGELFVVDRIAW